MASRKEPLSVTHPELAAQADGWDPSTMTTGTKKKVSWKCEKGHIWSAAINHRASGTGCPICSNKKVLAGYNDLSTTNPDLATQADGWDPTTLISGNKKIVSWKCEKGHIWAASINNRSRGTGCPFCSGRRVLSGQNDLATTHPELAAQADGWDPTTTTAGSEKKCLWRCQFGHNWETSPNNRSNGNTGCPFCSGLRVLSGQNDLATTHPELAAQADGWDPTKIKAGSSKKLQWMCDLGHQWVASVSDRSLKENGCPICSGRTVWTGLNDTATTHPELAAQADGWDPTKIKAGSNKRVQWKCQHGHQWVVSLNARSTGNSGCPFCSGLRVLSGFNDIATTHPELAAQADGWDPTTLNAGSNKKVGWICDLEHTWITSVNDRSSGNGCPFCSGHRVLAGFNDIATTHPELAAQADGWDPTTVNSGSGKRVRWRCGLEHQWVTSPNSRTNRQSGCPTCANSGFDPNIDGWLYFIDHDGLRMLQIGISNFPIERLSKHARRGWEVLEVRGPMQGHLARQLETAILHAVERRGAVLGHKAEIEKFDGYSEAWTKDSLSVTSFKQLLDWVYEDDQ